VACNARSVEVAAARAALSWFEAALALQVEGVARSKAACRRAARNIARLLRLEVRDPVDHESKQRRLRRGTGSERDCQCLLPALLPPVRENAFDQVRLLDARDDLEPPGM
jgi:hypothetical protein